MNLIGMGLMIKGLSEMSKGGGGGGYHSYGPSEEELFLRQCRNTLKIIETKENISGTEIPAMTLKGSEKLSPSKRKKQKAHSLQILQANPNGVNITGLSIDLSQYSVVGTIDNTRFFALDKKSKDLVVIDMKEYYSYGPHGDYYSSNNILNTNLKNDETSEISIDFKVVKENEMSAGISANMPQRRCYLSDIEHHPDIASFLELGNYIRQNAKEKQANTSANEMGE
ncbi:MAG: hypothetical protein IJX17_08335 [Clostridia bacterium]|nr:hypothetical protein [Clostridia bacterium]